MNERGTGKAINVGAKNSSGAYLLHVGADFRFIGKNLFTKVLDILKENKDCPIIILNLPLKPKFKSTLKNSFMYWDSRYSTFVSLPFVKREIFPSYPEISYGEDKIVFKKILPFLKEAKTFFVDEDFLRFNESFSIRDFIKRYLWYGRTFLPYLKVSKNPIEYLRISLSVLAVFFPPFLFIPALVGVIDSIKFIKVYPSNLVLFPIFSASASFLMGLGFLVGFFNKDLGH